MSEIQKLIAAHEEELIQKLSGLVRINSVESEPLADGRDGIQIPVPAEKDIPLRPGQGREKGVEYPDQFLCLQRPLRTLSAGDTPGQFVQHQSNLPAAAFLTVAFPPSLQTDVSGELAQKR